ncbi:hypothetical protein L202_02581 [Cryptococcus amylolentus CBS 6039]|uniref:Chromosome segregation in meiosis protein n=2 Tax=Cryptococcus amylolentus TaxID=104669 RepID=A0A1E3I127_9TREE|nr:hypothetical protein L202_02581 [Cryptococcus amylolentus CBS 6039]ODN82303.1 hypothetical protein L202_02581 [Cryptococcus amylolentus CBS 6039]ODO09628.1 hypothetical protein I350_01839 [Cryptococcus amylolentus CBS 6273]
MADLSSLFNSPPHSPPPPPRPQSRSRSTTPSTPLRPTRPRPEQEALFFSPSASQFGSPSASASQGQRWQPAQESSDTTTAGAGAAGGGRDQARRVEGRREDGGGIVRVRHAVNVVDSVDPLPRDTSSTSRGGGGGGGAFAGVYGAITDPLAGASGAGGDGGDEGEEEGGEKKRRPVAKVDADRLLSETTGLPALMRSAKKFKTHGKGREKDDLRNLLHMYQMWAHGMFPKGSFAQTMDRTEKVCRTRRMESAIGGLSDAFHGRRSPSPRFSPGASPTRSRSRSRSKSPSRAREASTQEPLFAETGGEDTWDGPDMYELMAMEAQEALEAQQGHQAAVEEDEFDGLYD